jgi:hypothetical protein
MMKFFGRNVVHGSDSPENGNREIGNIVLWLKMIFPLVLKPNFDVHYDYNISDNWETTDMHI